MKKAMALLLCLSLCLPFTACTKQNSKQKYSSYSFDYFDTVTSIVGYETDEAIFKQNAEEILSLLGEYHRLYTVYNSYEGVNNLCALNKLKDGVHPTLTVDRRIIDLLLFAKEMYTATNGKMNIAMGSVLSIWHDYRTAGMSDPEEAELPPMEKLLAAAEHTAIEDIVIDEAASSVFLRDPKMKLDVGAIAKGYATEQIAKMLESRGVSGYVLNVGGNVRTIGLRGDGTKWSVGIENPGEGDDYLNILALAGESLVTSGSYQRFYTVNGINYHHIIDPETLLPAAYYRSVSIVCKDSGFADGLSTALFCMPYEEGLALIEALDGVEAMWVTPDGEMTCSSGFSAWMEE